MLEITENLVTRTLTDNSARISSSESLLRLRITNPLIIHIFRPDINETESAFPLKVIIR